MKKLISLSSLIVSGYLLTSMTACTHAYQYRTQEYMLTAKEVCGGNVKEYSPVTGRVECGD